MRPAHASLVLLACLALSACSPAEQRAGDTAGPSPDAWTVTPRAIGSVQLGVPLAQVSVALNEPLKVNSNKDNPCAYARPRALPGGTSLMVVSDTVVRVDVDSNTVATAEGIRVGDSEAQVLARYPGRVRTEPHKYTDGHYLVVTPAAAADSAFRIIFETDGSRVLRFRAGRRPAVEWIEGCA